MFRLTPGLSEVVQDVCFVTEAWLWEHRRGGLLTCQLCGLKVRQGKRYAWAPGGLPEDAVCWPCPACVAGLGQPPPHPGIPRLCGRHCPPVWCGPKEGRRWLQPGEPESQGPAWGRLPRESPPWHPSLSLRCAERVEGRENGRSCCTPAPCSPPVLLEKCSFFRRWPVIWGWSSLRVIQTCVQGTHGLRHKPKRFPLAAQSPCFSENQQPGKWRGESGLTLDLQVTSAAPPASGFLFPLPSSACFPLAWSYVLVSGWVGQLTPAHASPAH